MKYAFIDYENLNSLDNLNLKEYSRVFLFLGASTNQTEIKLTEKFNDEINITLITVKDIGKNNVDFHIAYYLGKLDVTTDKDIEFHILSKDQGYDGLCRFIQLQRESRICSRQGNNAKQNIEKELPALPSSVDIEREEINRIFQEYKSFMTKREKRHLPAKILKLRNNIHNQTSLRGSSKQDVSDIITKVIDRLSQEKLLKITETKVSYP